MLAFAWIDHLVGPFELQLLFHSHLVELFDQLFSLLNGILVSILEFDVFLSLLYSLQLLFYVYLLLRWSHHQ